MSTKNWFSNGFVPLTWGGRWPFSNLNVNCCWARIIVYFWDKCLDIATFSVSYIYFYVSFSRCIRCCSIRFVSSKSNKHAVEMMFASIVLFYSFQSRIQFLYVFVDTHKHIRAMLEWRNHTTFICESMYPVAARCTICVTVYGAVHTASIALHFMRRCVCYPLSANDCSTNTIVVQATLPHPKPIPGSNQQHIISWNNVLCLEMFLT